MKNSILIIAVLVVVLMAFYFMSADDKTSTSIGTESDVEMMETETETEAEAETESEPEATVEIDASIEMSDGDVLDIESEVKVFNLTGKNFAFSESEIRVNKGDTVTINFESTEGFHDWVVDEFSAATEKVRPGAPTSVTFVADTTGTFEYYCSVGSHRAEGMVGNLIVE